MNKKFLSLVLALVMVLGTFTSVFAAEETKKEEVKKVEGKQQKIQYLVDNKFVEGDEKGQLNLSDNIKRSEITKLLVYGNGHKALSEKLQGSMKLYKDVETSHWANGVITVGSTVPSTANGQAMLNGYPNGTFLPDNNVTYAELAKMLVVLVKKDLTADMVKKANANWASQWMTWAAELGILQDVTVANSNAPATREDAFTMMYNALYAMKYIKKMPANETMGILSQLKNSELTLNQGDKAKTVKITNDTTFVLYNQHNTLDVNADAKSKVKNVFSNAVKVSSISNPSYYYGSLVRVLVNDKNEATHILELGNPRYLALGHSDNAKWQHTAITDNVIDPNRRWVDVADATVETSLTKEVTPNGGYGVAAKINYYNGNAKSITFAEGTLSRKPQNETGKEVYNNNFNFDRKGKSELNLRLTSTTRYFVADVLRNQLTEVKNVDEAIRILGNTTASNWFLDVYAGYENHSGRKPYETSTNTVLNDYNEATVVVFNAVQRDNNNAQLLRVKNEATTKYDITFENEKGEVVVNNVTTYRNYFPFNFNTHNDSAKLDVVEYTVNNAYGLEAEMIIDHSNTGRYPIVEVIGIQGRDIIVRGEFGETAVLQLDTDYALFLRGQLKVGALIQFHTLTNNVLPKDNKDVNKTNVVDVVSVMPANAGFTVRGSLRKVVEGNQANQSAGVVALKDFTDYGAQYQKVILSEIRNLYVASQYNQLGYFVLNNTEANALKAWLEAKPGKVDTIRFKVKPFNGYDKEFEIYDIEVLKDSNWVEVRTLVKDKLAELREAVRVLANKYPTEDSVTNENVFKFEEELNAVKALVAALVFPEDAAWNATDSVNGIYFNKLDTMKGWNLDAKKQAYVDNKADGVVANLPKEVKVAHNHETDTKAVKAAVKLAIEKYLNDSSITVEITSPADGDAITNPVASIKFKLTKGGKTSAEKELTNIAVSALN